MRTLDDAMHDLRPVINNDNFFFEIIPTLKISQTFSSRIHELSDENQDKRKSYTNKKSRQCRNYSPRDHVWVTLHPLRKSKQKWS